MTKQDFPILPKIIQDLFKEYAADEFLYWYPLHTLQKDIPVVAYDLDAIFRNEDIGQIADCLKKANITYCDFSQVQIGKTDVRRIHLTEHIYERDADGYNFPWYAEAYYFDGPHSEWIIYVSHEGTITFIGGRIVEIARNAIDMVYCCDVCDPT